MITRTSTLRQSFVNELMAHNDDTLSCAYAGSRHSGAPTYVYGLVSLQRARSC
jgi:hypothetical protein